MDPEAAKMILSRSIDLRKLCYTTFIGDRDFNSYTQVTQIYPTNLLPFHKEECLGHVSKRLKDALCIIKKNTLKLSFMDTKLSEPKANYIGTNYSTVILQHRGKWTAEIAEGLDTFLSHTLVGIIQTVLQISGAGWNKHPAQLSIESSRSIPNLRNERVL